MKKITLILALLILTPLIGQVVINEYSASNLYEYTDNYNMEEDWIELYNSSESDLDISGYYLSDKEDNPTKWAIPGGTIITAEGFLTFWCSGRDESSGSNFHTNFKLKQAKNNPEHVVFSDPDGNIINDIEMQKTQLDHSMGRDMDDPESWRIFIHPTKGDENLETNYIAYAEAATMNYKILLHNSLWLPLHKQYN